jgi:acyl CoA:acetate/3-ketoacid CoA transferase beta subunit
MTSKSKMKKLEGIPREMIALRASRELQDGWYVNLGIGIPYK